MNLTYPHVDLKLTNLIDRLEKLPQVQYAVKDQLMYLVDFANKTDCMMLLLS